MLLSIGMIMKNEEKYLERCLTALKPILEKVDSELIIADTGSTDNSFEIAQRFTDNVFHFEWIKDFAAARNSTLDRAQGEWYMFVDADEIMQDCSGIIRFFNTGEYKRYVNASIVIRSYGDEDDFSLFVDIRGLRLFKRGPNRRFAGKVHESLPVYETPTKYIHDIADHYGYLYKKKGELTELAYQKSKRNLELLLKMLEDPELDKPNIYAEIADSYDTVADDENSLKYIDMGLEKLNRRELNIIPYYSRKLRYFLNHERFEEAVEFAGDYFDPEKNPARPMVLASDCYVHWVRAYSYYKLRCYKESISEFVAFFKLYRKYTKGQLDTIDLMLDVFWINENTIMAAYDIFFRCCWQEKEYILADEYTKAIPLEKYSGNESFMENHIYIRLGIMDHVGYKGLDLLYRTADEFGRKILLREIRRNFFLVDSANKAVIARKLSVFEGVPSELSVIYGKYLENKPLFDETAEFIKAHGTEDGEDMLYILLDRQLDITPFVNAEDYFGDRAVQLMLKFYPGALTKTAEYNVENVSAEGLAKAINFYGWIMLRAMDHDQSVTTFFETYGALGQKWMEIYDNEPTIPVDVRAALLVNRVAAAKKSNKPNSAIAAAEKLLSVVKDLRPVVEEYKLENKKAFRARPVDPEFEKLAEQAKGNIRELISAGNISDASELLKELEGICPDDPDIDDLKKELGDTMQ